MEDGMSDQEELDKEPLEQEPEAEAIPLWPGWSSARQLIFVVLILGGATAGAFLAWQHFAGKVTDQPEYLLQATDIEITPRPAWVRSDVKAEVVRDAGLIKLNLLSPQVTVQIAQAFATHSWVAEVRRVSKHYPSKVVVELVYRKPAAMVEVCMQDKPGLLPVDGHGVLLPPEDFTPKEANEEFPRISVGNSVPAGPVGTAWGDPKVTGAARIAQAIGERWKDLKLHMILVAADGGTTRHGEPIYELSTKGKTRILWGHAPGEESSQEATAIQKAARLSQFVSEQGPLDGPSGPREIDVRDGQVRLQARTARAAP